MPSEKSPCLGCGTMRTSKTLSKYGGYDHKCFKKLNIEPTIWKKELNKGEMDEVLCIKKLFALQQAGDFITMVSIFKTNDAKEGIVILSPHDKKPVTVIDDIKKTGAHDKADVIIEFIYNKRRIYPSIKSKSGAAPSNLNHTNRSAYMFQNGYMKNYLHHLDHLVTRMNNQKYGFGGEFKKGTGEDQNIEDIQFITTSVKRTLIRVLIYSAFIGSGSGESKTKADCILIVNGNNTDNWEFIPGFTDEQKNQYANTIYPKITISIRSSKGMPKKPDKPDKETRSYAKRMKKYNDDMDLCQRWIYRHPNGSLKGAFHVRIRY